MADNGSASDEIGLLIQSLREGAEEKRNIVAIAIGSPSQPLAFSIWEKTLPPAEA